MTPEHVQLAERLAHRHGAFSAPAESRAVALTAVWLAQRTWVEGRGMSFRSWAWWYARGRLAQFCRREAKRRSRMADGFDPEWATSIAPEEPDERSAVRAAIARLPPAEREVIELRWLQGLTQVEAAAQLGTFRQQVAMIEKSALEKLRRALKADGYAPF